MLNLVATQMMTLLAESGGSLFFPEANSTVAGTVDNLFDLIFWISAFFFVLIVAVMAWFVFKYHRRPGHTEQPSASHNNALEITWSIVPGLILLVIFWQGFTGYMNIRQAPDDAYEIQVLGETWNWSFTYPNGHIDNNLHIPVDRPVRLVMQSKDVIHSMFIPAFRTKMDVVPGRYTEMWFQAQRPTGEGIDLTGHQPHDLFCAEYCGDGHSTMNKKVYVHPPGEFEAWLVDAGNLLEKYPPAEAGEKLFASRGCKQCHAVVEADLGRTMNGPPLLSGGLAQPRGGFGTAQQVSSGRGAAPETITIDENYIRESIRAPNAKVRVGFKAVMPVFGSERLSDEEITAIIAYIKSLK
ncbi:MAG: cytochrome c oxidase subunit II [Pirellulaceae bacterium]